MKIFLSKYKIDIICYCVILLVLTGFSILFWGKVGSPIIDCGREAYIPFAMLKGKVLYRDILNVYGPLSYQVNAVLYLIFGENLSTLYMAGIANSFIILTCLYYILRQFVTKFLSVSSCILILILCFFSPGVCSNFIFPYSYSTYYALTFFLLSFISLFLYIKNNTEIFIPFSFFMLGISIDFKVEYILFLPVLIISVFCFKTTKIKTKTIIFSTDLFFLASLISMSVLLVQGLHLHDIIRNFEFLNKYAKAPSMIYFFKFMGIYPDYKLFLYNAPFYMQSILVLMSLNFIFYFLLQGINKFNLKLLILLFSLILIFQSFSSVLLSNFPDIKQFGGLNPYDSRYFIGWLGISNLFILIIQSIYYFKFSDKSLKDKLFLVLILSSVLTNRAFFTMNTDSYGNYTFPLVLAVNLIFWVKYIPLYFKSFKSFKFLKFIKVIKVINFDNWQKSSALVILYVSIFFGFAYYSFATNPINSLSKTIPVITPRGIIYANKTQGYSLINTLNYIKTHFSKDATFVMYPEGPMLNFLTGRESDNHFHTLIPPGIEAYGEDFIIKHFSSSPPDYIIINNLDTFWYGNKYFGKDYAKKIMKFIFINIIKDVSSF